MRLSETLYIYQETPALTFKNCSAIGVLDDHSVITSDHADLSVILPGLKDIKLFHAQLK